MIVVVRGFAKWTPADGPADASRFEPRLRRRTTSLTRASAHVFDRATAELELAMERVRFVTASRYGELGVTAELLAMMSEGDGALSPTRFHNSVHNAAAGYLSIATHTLAGHTAIAAGPETTAMAILEAQSLLATGAAEHVVVLAAEDALPSPLREHHERAVEAYATAMVLSRSGDGPRLGLRWDPGRSGATPIGPAALVLVDLCASGVTADLALGSSGWRATVGPDLR